MEFLIRASCKTPKQPMFVILSVAKNLVFLGA
jgi:hypothetical protein